jgi:hypothetical protein
MIFNFEPEVDAIRSLLLAEDLDDSVNMKVAMVLATVFDKGMSMERERCIHIIQKLSVNAMDVVREIRKPQR